MFVERYACRIEVRYFSDEAMWEFWLLEVFVLADCWRCVWVVVVDDGVDERCDALL